MDYSERPCHDVSWFVTFMNYRYYCHLCTTFRSQQTSHMEPSATSTTVAGPVGEHLQAGTEDAPVLDRPAPLRCLHDSGAGFKYSDLLTPYSYYCPRNSIVPFLTTLHDP